MKKFNWFLVVTILLVFCCTGCTNTQSSSLEEAQYVASQQPDFGSLIQAISVSSGEAISLFLSKDPYLQQTNPKMELESGATVGNRSSNFVHLIIYEAKYFLNASPITTVGGIQKKTANKKCYLLILDDSRPCRIVAKKEIFFGTVLID